MCRQIVYSGLIRAFFAENSCLLQLEMKLVKVMKLTLKSKVMGHKTQTMSWKVLKSSIEFRETAELVMILCVFVTMSNTCYMT